jgi:hypothetical protein
MVETTVRCLVDFRERELRERMKAAMETAMEAMSLGELLYLVMFG